MRNLKSVFFLVLIGLFIDAGVQSITNTKTEKYLSIEGTQTFLMPPDGFENAANFSGFQDNATASSIVVMEIPGSYAEIKKGFSKENMSAKRMEFMSKEDYTINNFPSTLFLVKQFSPNHGYNFLKFILILNEGENKTLMINANFPESQKENLEEKIKQSVLSVYIDQSIKTDPFSSLDFEVDLNKSSFKLMNSISGSLMFKGPNNEFLMIAKPLRSYDVSDKKGAAITALKQISTISYKGLISAKEISQDGMDGYQLIANISKLPEENQ